MITALYLDNIHPTKISAIDPDFFKAMAFDITDVIGFHYAEENKVYFHPHATMDIDELINLVYYADNSGFHLDAETEYKMYDGTKLIEMFT